MAITAATTLIILLYSFYAFVPLMGRSLISHLPLYSILPCRESRDSVQPTWYIPPTFPKISIKPFIEFKRLYRWSGTCFSRSLSPSLSQTICWMSHPHLSLEIKAFHDSTMSSFLIMMVLAVSSRHSIIMKRNWMNTEYNNHKCKWSANKVNEKMFIHICRRQEYSMIDRPIQINYVLSFIKSFTPRVVYEKI